MPDRLVRGVPDLGFAPRDNDVLVVTYGEVKVPVIQYSTVSVGGLTYSRQLRVGDNPQQEYENIYGFLRLNAEKTAVEKVRLWADELAAVRDKVGR